MKMKIWTQQGVVEYSEADLEQHHKETKKAITRAKRKKLLQVEDGKVYFDVVAAYSIPNELQDLLKALVNVEAHGKAHALEDYKSGSEAYKVAHDKIERIHNIRLRMFLDLKTGQLKLSEPVCK